MDRQTLRNWVHRLNAPGAEAVSIIEQIPELAHVGRSWLSSRRSSIAADFEQDKAFPNRPRDFMKRSKSRRRAPHSATLRASKRKDLGEGVAAKIRIAGAMRNSR
jgi:hypothetical protein